MPEPLMPRGMFFQIPHSDVELSKDEQTVAEKLIAQVGERAFEDLREALVKPEVSRASILYIVSLCTPKQWCQIEKVVMSALLKEHKPQDLIRLEENLTRRMQLALLLLHTGYMDDDEKLAEFLNTFVGLFGATSIENRIALCTKVARRGGRSIKALVANFDKLGFVDDGQKCTTVKERISFWSRIAGEGEWVARSLAVHFDKLGLGNVTTKQRLDLCTKIARKGALAAGSLATNFDKLGFIEDGQKYATAKECISFWFEIVQQEEWVAEALAINFDKLNLDEATTEQRLDLCIEIARQGELAAISLAVHFDKLGLGDATTEQRLALCTEIVRQGARAVEALTVNFDKFGLGDATTKQRLDLCVEIVRKGGRAVGKLIANLDKFRLGDATTEQRLNLCARIAGEGEGAAISLVTNFDKFRLGDATTKQRLDLCIEIARQGELAAISLVPNFDKFRLGNATTKQRLDLCIEIARQGNRAAGSLLTNFYKLGFIDDGQKYATVKERISFWLEIVQQGEWAASGLADNFDKLGLGKATTEQQLDLCTEIARKGETAALCLSRFVQKLKRDFKDYFVVFPPYLFQNEEFTVRLQDNLSDIPKSMSKLLRPRENNEGLNADVEDFEKLIHDDPSFKYFDTFFESVKKEMEKLDGKMKTKIEKKPSQREEYEGTFQMVEREMVRWSAYAAGLFSTLEKDKQEAVSESQLFKKVLEIENWPLRYSLVYELCKLAGKDSSVLKDVPKLPSKEVAFGDRVRPWILAKRLQTLGLPQKTIDSFYNHICSAKEFKDYMRARYLYDLLLGCIALGPFSEDEIKGLDDSIKSLLSPLEKITTLENEKNELSQLRPNAMKHEQKVINKKNEELAKKRVTSAEKERAAIDRTLNENNKRLQVIQTNLERWSAVTEELNDLRKHRPILNEVMPELTALTNILGNLTKREFFDIVVRKQTEAESKKSFRDFFAEKFSELFSGLKEIEDIFSKYAKTFDQFRDKAALFTYLGKIRTLPQPDRDLVCKSLSKYVAAVLEGRFPKERYLITEETPHLKAIFADKKICEAWMDKSNIQKISVVSEPDYKAFFVQKIITDKHLVPAEYPVLKAFLERKDVDYKALEIVEGMNEDEQQKIKFQKHVIALCRKEETAETFIKNIKGMHLGPFEDDFPALQQLAHPVTSGTRYTICETDDSCDLLLIGTEVLGSCQSVNESPSTNKCLCGYLWGGEIDPIVAKNENGKIVSRSIMRLLVDEDDKPIAIVQERLYDNTGSPKVAKAINEMAVAKAKKMGLSLVSKEIGSGLPYVGTLKYLGGAAPYVYSDAGGGVKSGPFEIRGNHVLYEPPKV